MNEVKVEKVSVGNGQAARLPIDMYIKMLRRRMNKFDEDAKSVTSDPYGK